MQPAKVISMYQDNIAQILLFQYSLSYDFDKFIQDSINSPNCWRDVKEKISQRSGVCGEIYLFYNELKIKQMHQINFMSNPS